MIRILHVVTKMGYGGLEAMLMNYYRYIDREQIQFDFLVHRPEEADYHDEIRALGGTIFHLPQLNPFSSSYKKALADFFHTHPEYRLIHVHLNCMSSVVLKVAKSCGVPYRIAHSHSSNQVKNLKYPIKKYCKRQIPQYATKLFACGVDAGSFMFGNADYELLYNAIDVRDYTYSPERYTSMRQQLGIAEDELLIGHIGKFRYQKNQSFLVDVFAEIIKSRKAKLLLIGTGELVDTVQEKVHTMGLADQVIFTGVRADVADLLQAMDVFVFPSMYEGLPVVLIEAQAAGLPCLMSDTVAIESKKTDLVTTLPLSSGALQWADKSIEIAATKRCNTYEEIMKSGYDIRENAKRLQNYYIRTYNGEENTCLY